MEILNEQEYKRSYHLLKQIIKSIIPITDIYKLEDYIHDCMVYLVKKRIKEPGCELKTSYLKHVAIKICVDSLRSMSTNIKYYCPLCGDYFNRKEKAIECCIEGKQEAINTVKHHYSVGYNETSIGAAYLEEGDFTNTIDCDDKEMRLNPAFLAEKSEFFDQFMSFLSEIQRKIIFLIQDGVNIRKMKTILNMECKELSKNIKQIRFTYRWLEAKCK